MSGLFLLLWFIDTFTRNENSTGLWKRHSSLQRLDEKVENLVGDTKSLVNEVFSCAIKFYCWVIYCIITEKLKGSYRVLRDWVGHTPVLCPSAQQLSDIYWLHQQCGKKKRHTTCRNNNCYLRKSSCISQATVCISWADRSPGLWYIGQSPQAIHSLLVPAHMARPGESRRRYWTRPCRPSAGRADDKTWDPPGCTGLETAGWCLFLFYFMTFNRQQTKAILLWSSFGFVHLDLGFGLLS